MKSNMNVGSDHIMNGLLGNQKGLLFCYIYGGLPLGSCNCVLELEDVVVMVKEKQRKKKTSRNNPE